MKFLYIFYTDPGPSSATPLTSAASIHGCAVARDVCEVVGAPVGVAEAEQIDVEMKTGSHVLYAKDGGRWFQIGRAKQVWPSRVSGLAFYRRAKSFNYLGPSHSDAHCGP